MDKKRKKSYYIKSAKGNKKSKTSHTLEAGMRGYFITCNKQESQAVRDAYSLLNEYADRLHGPEQSEVTSDSDCDDIEAAMKKEVESLKQQHKTERRFQAVNTGAANCLFIKTTLPDPTPISDLILQELHETKTSKSRHIMKFFPVIGSCKTELDKISTLALDVLETQLKGINDFTYSVEIKIRNNADLKKNDVMRNMTQAISDLKPMAKVKLSGADYVFSVNAVKRVLCLSVLKNYAKYRKYNLQEIVAVKEESQEKSDANQIEPSEQTEKDVAKTDEKFSDVESTGIKEGENEKK